MSIPQAARRCKRALNKEKRIESSGDCHRRKPTARFVCGYSDSDSDADNEGKIQVII